MTPQTIATSELTSEQLLERHHLTKEVANLCRQQLRAYLDALAPLFRPRRVLGDRVEGNGRESVPEAQQNFAVLAQTYSRISGRPFDLRRDLAPPIESPSTQMQLSEWEYLHEIRTGRERRQIMVTSPLTWVLTYPCTYSLPLMRQVAAGRQERDYEAVRSFALRACILSLLFEKQPQLVTLLEGLRYKVELRTLPDLGELPLVTISAPVTAFRPSDELLMIATGFSGRAVFQEVLDTAAATRVRDPLQDRISAILRNHQIEAAE